MQSLQEILKSHEQDINAFNPSNATELEEYRIKYLGTKGIVKAVFGEMKNVPVEQKKDAGQLLNTFKQLAEAKYEAFSHLQNDNAKKDNGLDITLPGTPLPLGTRHPLRMVENEIVSIFEKIGFSVATGP
jgi:phenylalanyl-tRNA synthetase alpha chain